jgi:hypothetical protein
MKAGYRRKMSASNPAALIECGGIWREKLNMYQY